MHVNFESQQELEITQFIKKKIEDVNVHFKLTIIVKLVNIVS